MEFAGGRKRGRPETALNGNGFKKTKQETEFYSSGIGSKSKPCTKFFSTAGCPFGEGCHFLHYVPGGLKAVSQMVNLRGNQPLPPAARNPGIPPSFPDGSSPPAVKTRLCNKFNSPEGCKFGDKCHFAHGEWEIGKPTAPSYEDPRAMGPMPDRIGHHRQYEPSPRGFGAASSFGASATAKISVDASLTGTIIGKFGANSKQIYRLTGAKLSIKDHEADPNLRNIELEGSFDQIKQASAMVRELIVTASRARPPSRNPEIRGPNRANNFKTKLCENYAKGTCTFGDRCHFAHGAEQLRKTGI